MPIAIALGVAHRFISRKSYDEFHARPLGPVSGKRILVALLVVLVFVLALVIAALFE